MPITINSNVTSLRAQRTLALSSRKLTHTFEKLSSGLRITRAMDDAAGMCIADRLKADSTIAKVAIRNANDGLSMLDIADKALGQVNNILVRMAELAEQSANGVYSTTQRSGLDQEFQALGSEIQRITEFTVFNDLKLLSTADNYDLQVGYSGSDPWAKVEIAPPQATLKQFGLAVGHPQQLSFSINAGANDMAQIAARSALDVVKAAIDSVSLARGAIGAGQSRLEVTINNLMVARENMMAAESQIRDVDIAEEGAELTRLNILQQAGSSILAQANQQPQMALSLLG